jgi:hypothetical protein
LKSTRINNRFDWSILCPRLDFAFRQLDEENLHSSDFAAKIPLNIPFAASVAPKRMFDSTDSESSDDTRRKKGNKGKVSAPPVADEDYGEKQKGQQPQRGSKKKPAIIDIDVDEDEDEDEESDDDDVNYKDGKAKGKTTLAGKAKAAPASSSGCVARKKILNNQQQNR